MAPWLRGPPLRGPRGHSSALEPRGPPCAHTRAPRAARPVAGSAAVRRLCRGQEVPPEHAALRLPAVSDHEGDLRLILLDHPLDRVGPAGGHALVRRQVALPLQPQLLAPQRRPLASPGTR